MTTSTKEQVMIFLSLVIIYLGVYTLQSNDVTSSGASTARWAGFFSVTVGVFAILTLLFKRPTLGAVGSLEVAEIGYHNYFFPLVTLIAVLGSAFFTWKLIQNGVRSDTLKWALYGQLIALVLLILSYFLDFNLNKEVLRQVRPGSVRVAPVTTTGLPGSYGLTSPRMPMRAR